MHDRRNTVPQDRPETVTTSVTIPKPLHTRARRAAIDAETTLQGLVIEGLAVICEQIEKGSATTESTEVTKHETALSGK